MSLTWSAEQQILRNNARELVRSHAPVTHFRKLRDTRDATGFSEQLWSQMRELGWSGITIPEAYDGLGLGLTELAIVLEECGRLLVPQPMLAAQLLGGALVLHAGSDAQKQALLPQVASGDAIVAAAIEESRRFAPYEVSTRAEKKGERFVITGSKRFVIDGHVASQLVVSARTAGESGDRDGITLFLVDPKQTGVHVERISMVDCRNAASVQLTGVEVSAGDVLGSVNDGARALDAALDRATIGVCAEMLGLLTQAYETTIEYLKTRVQFDQLIGSFQALQHRAVTMFCEIELCQSMVRGALEAADENSEQLAVLASACKARLTDASKLIAREAIQLHGGIGMTDEHDIGFYMKRAAVLETTLGDAAYHRDRFARLKGF